MSPGGEIDPALDRWLADGAWMGTPCEGAIETAISKVYLYPDRALKLKKPVSLGYLDFTTPEKRRWAAEREFAFNHAFSGDLYRAVRGVTRRAGAFTLEDNAGAEAADWLVEMRRFEQGAILANDPGRVDGALGEAIGRAVAPLHAGAEPLRERGGAEGLRYVLESNAGHLRSLAPMLGAAEVEAVIADSDAAFARMAPLLDRRRNQGWVRRCHADLHLGNLLIEDGRVRPFDCIEFSDVLSEIDVLYDLAFPLMDLGVRGRPEAANRALNGWLDAAARAGDEGLYAGLAALPLFQATRAAVRAHVSGHNGQAEAARAYLAAARSHLTRHPPRLVAMGGLSGSGKTSLARAIAPSLGAAPGAVVLRSDEVRKRLWGAGPLDRLPQEAYAPGESGRVHALMLTEARAVLEAGWPAVLDAVFLRPEERDSAQALASELDAPFDGVWLELHAEALRARVTARTGDASDATAEVVSAQAAQDPGPIGWRRRSAELPVAELTRLVLGRPTSA